MPLSVPTGPRSIERVSAPGQDINLVPQDSITIQADPQGRQIRIGEAHSARTDNPHQVTAAQVGAPVSVGGVSNPGGDIALAEGGAILIIPDTLGRRIVIDETHSARTDNPHQTTAAQVGALVSIDGVANAGGDVDLVAGANIAITPDNTAKRITLAVVQGAGSGLDADLLDGMQPSTAATANTIMQRDSAGRAKVAAPVEADDIARKAEVDAVQANLGAHAARTDNPHQTTAEQVGAVRNAGGVPQWMADTLSNRPAPGVPGRLYWGTDTRRMYRDSGTSWESLVVDTASTLQNYLPATDAQANTVAVRNASGELVATGFWTSGGYNRASRGYTKLVNGLIIQWGTDGHTTSPHIQVTFPIAFPKACLKIVTSKADPIPSWEACACQFSNTHFTLYMDPAKPTDARVHWLAIGY